MLVKVLKSFPYSADGMRTVTVGAGAILDVSDDLVAGLQGEGFIDEASADEIEAAQAGAVVMEPPVEIPDDWRDLHWFKLKPLARALNGGADVANKAAAIAIVEAELDRRGA